MNIQFPRPLSPPTRVGLIAPASFPADMTRIEAGIEVMAQRGLTVERFRTPGAGRGYLAGSDDERAAELNHFLRRTDIDALICVRGGYGCMRLLDRIDWDAARAHSKLLVGYSDITALHLAFFKHAGWTGISGPMAAVEWPDPDIPSLNQFFALAAGWTGSLAGPSDEPMRGLNPGTATGRILGGNLSMVVRLLGTPHLPDLTGAILIVEDVGEEPYQIDAYFSQLRMAGVLDRLGGLVLGGLTEGDVRPGKASLTMEEVLSDYVQPLSIPVADRLLYGHFPVKCSLPIGVQARLTVSGPDARLDVLESVVAS